MEERQTRKGIRDILNGTYANPVIMVDELDKAGGGNQYDPLGALYMLLERDTAAEFVDEFVEIPIDASGVVWIATANEESKIPDPILNRMNVYAVGSPDRDGSARIAQAIYGEIRGSHDWGKDFPKGSRRRCRIGSRSSRPGNAPRHHERVRQREACGPRRNRRLRHRRCPIAEKAADRILDDRPRR